jgi:VIT1/CCC1 family predicted Fe2+/Mn2+ transporter
LSGAALCQNDRMGQAVSDAARKLLAVAILLVAAYILFKVVIGVVATIAWIAVVVLAIVGVVWAIRVL